MRTIEGKIVVLGAQGNHYSKTVLCIRSTIALSCDEIWQFWVCIL